MMLAEVAEQRAPAVPSAPLTEFELLRRSLVSCARGPALGGGGAASGQGATSEADNGKVEESLKRPLYSDFIL